ncbi:MAG: glycerol-3-phosphate 1-O-acyltransferase PlsY [Magnetococcus sp. YQC-5]
MSVLMLSTVLGSYLLGAVPFGVLVARILGAGDIRQQGSGNIGATNVLRVAGRKAGAMVLLLDMAKGALAAWVGMMLFGADSRVTAAVVFLVFLGHLYPIYLGFKGGKGVAVALGAVLVWIPGIGLFFALIWLVSAWWFRISSLAALLGFGSAWMALFWMPGPPDGLVTWGLMTLLVFWRHRDNMRRLLQGTEPTIGQKRSPTPDET